MKTLLYCLITCLSLCCRREAEPLSLDGTYTGTFQRGTNNPVPVNVTFSGGRYTGKVSNTLTNGVYPSICEGKFKALPGVIYFENECAFTANFDWSLILSQEWHVESTGDQLILDRNSDRYILVR